jgi:hypothetical protein
LRRHLVGGVAQQEADGDDHVVALLGELGDVVLIVGLGLRLLKLASSMPPTSETMPTLNLTSGTSVGGGASVGASVGAGASVGFGPQATATIATMVTKANIAHNFLFISDLLVLMIN